MKPGVYPGVPLADYLRAPAVSAGLLSTLLDRCPRAAWAESWLNPEPLPRDDNGASDAGTIAHAILLEGSEDCCEIIDPRDYPAQSTGAIPEGWTNVAIRAARDRARALGKVPVLRPEMERIRAMVGAASAYIDSLRAHEPAVWSAFREPGDSELSVLWDDAGTLCRMRPDKISAARDVIVDLKFTQRSAEPGSWGRSQLAPMGYATSAAWYRRGARKVWNTDCAYLFLVVESSPPYLCSLVGLDPTWQAYGDANVRAGLAAWQRCVERNEWPAYPARAAYPEMPGWMLAQMESREIESVGTPGGWQKLYGEMPA